MQTVFVYNFPELLSACYCVSFQVYLDVKYALDPEIKFEVELLPPRQVSGWRPLVEDGESGSSAEGHDKAYTVSFSDSPPPYSDYEMYPTSSNAPVESGSNM